MASLEKCCSSALLSFFFSVLPAAPSDKDVDSLVRLVVRPRVVSDLLGILLESCLELFQRDAVEDPAVVCALVVEKVPEQLPGDRVLVVDFTLVPVVNGSPVSLEVFVLLWDELLVDVPLAGLQELAGGSLEGLSVLGRAVSILVPEAVCKWPGFLGRVC